MSFGIRSTDLLEAPVRAAAATLPACPVYTPSMV
jgi:hypothetical protein